MNPIEVVRCDVGTAERIPLLDVRSLDVSYGKVSAVRGLSLVVDQGEAVGLIGANGAGKSSTLSAIMGAVRRSGGDVLLAGRSLPSGRPERVAGLGVAMVPEGRHLFASMTVRENLLLGKLARRVGRMPRLDDDAIAEMFPVTVEFADRRAGLLSGGQQQQVAIARAMLADPDLLLLDEPSLGLAPSAVSTVFSALGQIRSLDVAILLVEQRAEVTRSFCSRSYVLAGGSVKLEVTSGTDLESVTAAYFGR